MTSSCSDGSPHGLPRAARRVISSAEVKLRRPGQKSYCVKLFDVSPEGCKTEFVERPGLHEHVLVKFDGLNALPATVCWVRGFEGGLKFENPIHPAVFEMLVAKLGK